MQRIQALIDAGILPSDHQLSNDEIDAIASLSEQELEQLVRSQPGRQRVAPGAPTFAVVV